MIDQDLQRLAAREQPALDGLEAAIWERENELFAARMMSRRLAVCQAGVLALAILGAAGLGTAAGQPHAAPEIVTLSDLSPLYLILGGPE
jgi:hypothetical protein